MNRRRGRREPRPGHEDAVRELDPLRRRRERQQHLNVLGELLEAKNSNRNEGTRSLTTNAIGVCRQVRGVPMATGSGTTAVGRTAARAGEPQARDGTHSNAFRLSTTPLRQLSRLHQSATSEACGFLRLSPATATADARCRGSPRPGDCRASSSGRRYPRCAASCGVHTERPLFSRYCWW